ncbi:MAG: ABC transporter permease [Thermoprotei archaeon]
MRVLQLIKSETLLVYGELLRRKQVLLTYIAYPYIMTFFIIFVGSSVGSLENFEAKVGVNPFLFFIAASFNFLVILGIVDDVLWSPIYDDNIGTLPYVLSSTTPWFLRLLVIPIPRLALTMILGFTSLIPIFTYFEGLEGLLTSSLIMGLAGLAGLLLSTFAILLACSISMLMGESWRLLNIVRPLMMILLGIYYPRVLMPLAVRIISYLLPSSHVVDLMLYTLVSERMPEVLRALTWLGAGTALAVAYGPLSYNSTKSLETKKLREGIKT